MAEKNKPLLDISTLVPEPMEISIDGQNYPLLDFSSMGPREQTRFVKLGNRVQELRALDEMTDADADELDTLVHEFVGMIVSIPEDVLAKLRFHHCSEIIKVFTRASGLDIPAPAQAEQADQEDQQTGAK